MVYKVYITLGFHINFYHSWRGDTPDEAGFGTDIRVIRGILAMLDRANTAGLQARGYWDTEVYWTFQEILPKHSPDLLEGIRRRVQAGLDEIVLGPFNNGANHAATADEFRRSVAWGIENPWGSGLKQLFGKVSPFYRPQETMFTVGQETILKECGVDGVMFFYAGVPFNTFSNFIPCLEDEKRYNLLWFRSREDQPKLMLLPCIAAGDLVEQISLESMMLDLHRKQLRGEIQSDVIININEDADLETWLPSIRWLPNMGGLEEFIHVVNKYPWAEFTLPSEYAASHAPKGEVLVRQDLADGGFDGNYSWAEKCASLRAWTLLEGSRLASYRAETLARRTGLDLDPILWEGMDSSFFQRLIGLTTTHFGMSTPIINEERQDKAFAILGKARSLAMDAERQAARRLRKPVSTAETGGGAVPLYDFELYPMPASRVVAPAHGLIPVSLPVVLPADIKAVSLEDEAGRRLPATLTDPEPLTEGRISAQVRLIADLRSVERLRLRIRPSSGSLAPFVKTLKNRWLEATFSEIHGVESLTFNGETIGRPGFLNPFVTYDKHTFHAVGYKFVPLTGECWDGLQRIRLTARIPMKTRAGEFTHEMTYTFTLFSELPHLFLEVEARYACTPKRQIIHNMTQKLRRLMDLRWVETAPCALTPAWSAPADKPLRVWKHNYMGITSFYDLEYGRFNSKNRNLDSFNHQVTAGWVAVSNGKQGLLVGEQAQGLSSMAFCPMRLREKDGRQVISLNPFGSYFGKQLDYSHLGGNGNGTVIMQAFSGALAPNGPSFNGETLRFSLLLAPYEGDEPPQELQELAAMHFYTPGSIVHAAPAEIEAVTFNDIEQFITAEQERATLAAQTPLDPPSAFLANPSPGAMDLVWDAPRRGRVTGYEIQWRARADSAWESARIDQRTRWHKDDLADGQPMRFRMRSLCGASYSDWTPEQACTPGAVTGSSILAMLERLPLWTLVKVIAADLWSLVRANFHK
jgi:hypothetical protein